jgi:hypothetical protein
MVSVAQVSQSIIERLDTPLRVQGGGDEQLTTMAAVVPMTLASHVMIRCLLMSRLMSR